MLFPPPPSRSIRLIGLVGILSLVALLGAPAGQPATAVQSAARAAGTASVTSANAQTSAQAQAVGPQWAWPVDQARALVRAYRAPATPYSAGHRGIDVVADFGAAAIAPADGVVHFAGVVVDRPVLSIRHAGGLISSFDPVDSTLAAGTPVRRGEDVGAVGVGHCSVPCLHFGVRRHGDYLSPLNYLGGIPHSVLLPTRRIG